MTTIPNNEITIHKPLPIQMDCCQTCRIQQLYKFLTYNTIKIKKNLQLINTIANHTPHVLNNSLTQSHLNPKLILGKPTSHAAID